MKRESENDNYRSLETVDTVNAMGTNNCFKGNIFLRDIAKNNILRKQGRYLPHWTADGVIYHVRFRLADSFPAKIRKQLREEKDRILAVVRDEDPRLTRFDKKQLMKLYRVNVDLHLNEGYGSCWLARESIGQLVAHALKFFENERYKLLAWCVMPNHVHVVLQPGDKFKLGDIVHSWKSYTANKANVILKRTGSFWQREYFDRIIRDNDELISTIDYVWINPEKAGLGKWKYRWRVDNSE